MSREILTVVETVSNEKGVSREAIFQALEQALVAATKKKFYENTTASEARLRVEIDRKTGDYRTFRQWEVVADEDHEMPACQDAISDVDPSEWSIGDIRELEVESIEFGRIAAQIAKQVIVQKIREAERALVADAYESKVGELIYGEVKKQTKEGFIIDLGDGAEAYLAKDETIPKEMLRPKQRISAILYNVNREGRGAQLLLSRAKPEMLIALMKKEVPEIAEEIIEIRAAARQPGVRAKISVKTNDHRIDPVGACIGMRGTRIQAVQQELNGERIDVVVWSDDPAQYIASALEPADVSGIVIDEDAHSADIIFATNEQLARAIGSQGQNVRLASELTGYKLDMMLEDEYRSRQESEAQQYVDMFVQRLDIDQELAAALVEMGFTSLEEVAYVPAETFDEIGLDEETVVALQERAKEAALTDVLRQQESIKQATEELLGMEGMTPEIAQALAQRGIATLDDLADQAIDDIVDIDGLNEAKAGQLIMKARESWFN
ncbi:transcription termination/antitermination protein NusA [Acinetobacter qingfengensis]|uniref:Transcription termination/antitermination protein NusA n=1 Tax=Acinetobacter qingfengensis TaxID=1262585 RepID=A0A1E7RDW3_9GAMM|nr:transcription termination factor NusA [Acinetobacter qingfengensis]KAA8733708.1 transcription termination/antitermination protein NusA [Acinetobacter qingfengensis]OEY97476.1 transcription termination/antitermination protein NusA [Acinetobacter qingfengensis]